MVGWLLFFGALMAGLGLAIGSLGHEFGFVIVLWSFVPWFAGIVVSIVASKGAPVSARIAAVGFALAFIATFLSFLGLSIPGVMETGLFWVAFVLVAFAILAHLRRLTR